MNLYFGFYKQWRMDYMYFNIRTPQKFDVSFAWFFCEYSINYKVLSALNIHYNMTAWISGAKL